MRRPDPLHGPRGGRAPRRLLLGGVLAAMVLHVPAARAVHAVNWYAIPGGGSTAAGGPYALRSAIGQPEAGVSAAGPYALRGGFWTAANAVYQTSVGPGGTVEPPPALALDAPRPNPALTSTRVSFALPQEALVRVLLYDAAGRLVRVLVEEPLGPGRHALVWDGTDAGGERASAGIYFLRFESGTFRAHRRLVLLR